jgi:hypothetical protein
LTSHVVPVTGSPTFTHLSVPGSRFSII